jgi:hypothetical protein
MATAWSFLTLDAPERQFAGNAGYDDVLTRHSSWDQTVPNHRRVSQGDLAVLRDSEFVLGIGWIDDIVVWKADKDRYRCPSCNRTGFKERRTMFPRFRCTCGEQLDEPTVDRLTGVDHYRAYFGRTWSFMDVALTVDKLARAYLNNASQHAIREMDLRAVQEIIDATDRLGSLW